MGLCVSPKLQRAPELAQFGSFPAGIFARGRGFVEV